MMMEIVLPVRASKIFHLMSADLRTFAQKDGSGEGDVEALYINANLMWDLN
jgi:hypothetical protein